MSKVSTLPGFIVNDTMTRFRQNETGSAVPVFILSTDKPGLSLSRCDSFEQFTGVVTKSQVKLSDIAIKGIQLYFNNDGGPCYVQGITADQARPEALKTTLQNVLATHDITVLAMPEHPDLWEATMTLCSSSRPDVFCLIDLPRTPENRNAFIAQFQHSPDGALKWGDRAAAYWPWLVSEYRTDGNKVVLPPSFAVAAVIGKTDQTEGIWKAPANTDLIHILSPDVATVPLQVPDAVQVNDIVSLPGLGTRIWGCRTFMPSAHSRYHYVQVRRLMTFIEYNLSELARFMLFEPNNAMTWFKYKGIADDWLRSLWQAGGLAGEAEADAWRLEIGLGETMTGEDITSGLSRIRVHVRPPDIAESLTLELNLTLYEASVSSHSL